MYYLKSTNFWMFGFYSFLLLFYHEGAFPFSRFGYDIQPYQQK